MYQIKTIKYRPGVYFVGSKVEDFLNIGHLIFETNHLWFWPHTFSVREPQHCNKNQRTQIAFSIQSYHIGIVFCLYTNAVFTKYKIHMLNYIERDKKNTQSYHIYDFSVVIRDKIGAPVSRMICPAENYRCSLIGWKLALSICQHGSKTTKSKCSQEFFSKKDILNWNDFGDSLWFC